MKEHGLDDQSQAKTIRQHKRCIYIGNVKGTITKYNENGSFGQISQMIPD